MSKLNQLNMYMDIALRVARESKCKRAQVGAVLTKGNNIIAYGWNGMPQGEDNCCEDVDGITYPDVDHAEDNCYAKLLNSHESANNSTLYVTLAPCKKCAQLIKRAGTVQVFYHSNPKLRMAGIEYLRKHNINVTLLRN